MTDTHVSKEILYSGKDREEWFLNPFQNQMMILPLNPKTASDKKMKLNRPVRYSSIHAKLKSSERKYS